MTNNFLIVVYLVFSLFVFLLGLLTAWEDQQLVKYWTEKYQKEGIEFHYIGEGFTAVNVLILFVSSFIPILNILSLISLILYRRGYL